jgi:exosortase/archaeosortase family protein
MISWPEVIWNANIIGTQNGHSIIVYASCSSLHNISLGLLCWVSIKSLVRTHWQRADVGIGLLVCAVVVLLNVSRLYLTALSPEQYAYWHGGFGEEIYLWATTLIVLLISLWGALRVRQMS